MSLLSAASRAGPSTANGRLLSRVRLPQAPGAAGSVRGRKSQTENPVASEPGYIKNRPDSQRPTKRKKFPQFRQLPDNQLQNPIFTQVRDLDLPFFSTKLVKRAGSIGEPVELDLPNNDPLRIFGVPKNLLLEFRLLSKHYSVIRGVTKEGVVMLEKAKDESSKDNRVVLTGRPGSGKSFLMIQMVEHAISNHWVVVYIPRAVDTVNATTNYAYDIRTRTYFQPQFSVQTLKRLYTVNLSILKNIPLGSDLVLERLTLPASTMLNEVIRLALADFTRSNAAAPVVLNAVMDALSNQTEYPVLFAVDQLQALYGKTAYKNPQFEAIKPYHLSFPRMVMEFASGKRVFERGFFLGAISSAQSTNPVQIELRDALDLSYLDTHVVTEYEKRDSTMVEYTNGLKKLEVPEKLTLQEAAGVFEIWKGRKVFGSPSTYYDEVFLSKYTESGGNPREFVYKGLLANFQV